MNQTNLLNPIKNHRNSNSVPKGQEKAFFKPKGPILNTIDRSSMLGKVLQ